MSSAAPTGQPSEPRKRRVKRRSTEPRSPLDIGFEPLFSSGRRQSRRLSAADLLLRKEYERALGGSIPDVIAILKRDQENQKALQ